MQLPNFLGITNDKREWLVNLTEIKYITYYITNYSPHDHLPSEDGKNLYWISINLGNNRVNVEFDDEESMLDEFKRIRQQLSIRMLLN